MNHRSRQPNSESKSSKSNSNSNSIILPSSIPSKRSIETSSPTQKFNQSNQFSSHSIHSNSLIKSKSLSKNSNLSHHHNNLNSLPNLSSSGWNRIGDDDDLFIQSDDTQFLKSKLNSSKTSPSQSSFQNKKRKRILNSSKFLKPNSIPTRSSLQSQNLPNLAPSRHHSHSSTNIDSSKLHLKFDHEGCSNCKTNHSLCWWKKHKPITNRDGNQILVEEKLCNACSLYWNKNGHHRSIKQKSIKSSNLSQFHPSSSSNINQSSSLHRKSNSNKHLIGPSSPTALIVKHHPPSSRRLRSPSQLTLAAEREARMLKKKILAKANSKNEKNSRDSHQLISDDDASENDQISQIFAFNDPIPSPFSQSRLKNHKTRRSSSNLNRKPQSIPFETLDQSSKNHHHHHHQENNSNNHHDLLNNLFLNSDQILYSDQINFSPLLNQPSNHFSPSFENIFRSPPRTPPPNHLKNNNINKHSPQNQNQSSPSRIFDFDNLLSPSFLNASPNSLLRKLNPQKQTLNHTPEKDLNLSTSFLSNCSLEISERVFSPTRNLSSPNVLQNFMIEPSKKIDLSSNSSIIAIPEFQLEKDSSNQKKLSIFLAPSPKSINQPPPITQSTSEINLNLTSSDSFDKSFIHSKDRRIKKNLSTNSKLNTSPTQAILDINLQSVGSFNKISLGSNRKKNRHSTNSPFTVGPCSRSKNPTVRKLWSQRLSSCGVSSEDSQIEEVLGPIGISSQPASVSQQSECESLGTPIDRLMEASALNTTVSQSMDSLFSVDLFLNGHFTTASSDINILPPSSPPCLPPPSDCSEGITPHSAEAYSDEVKDDEIKNDNQLSRLKIARNHSTGYPKLEDGLESSTHIDYDLPVESLDHHHPLGDITPNLNRLESEITNSRFKLTGIKDSTQNRVVNLSSEIMTGLSDAIKADWSTEDWTHVLKSINSPQTLHSSHQLTHHNPTSYQQQQIDNSSLI